MILLDTSVLVPYFRSDPAITNRLAEAEVAVPATVLGELYFGAEVRAHSERHARDVDSLLDRALVLNCGPVTARHYGRVKADLAKRGEMIPENDIWIAAAALEHSLPVATRDAHFDRITGSSGFTLVTGGLQR